MSVDTICRLGSRLNPKGSPSAGRLSPSSVQNWTIQIMIGRMDINEGIPTVECSSSRNVVGPLPGALNAQHRGGFPQPLSECDTGLARCFYNRMALWLL